MPKPDDDQTPNEVFKKQNRFGQIVAKINWTYLAREIGGKTDTELKTKVASYLLQAEASTATLAAIDLTGATPEEKIKRISCTITSLPEYQLC
jgi:hypothetical protein